MQNKLCKLKIVIPFYNVDLAMLKGRGLVHNDYVDRVTESATT